MDKSYFLQKIQSKRPINFEHYDYGCVPNTFLATDKIMIRCKQHGVFEQRACSHLHGYGCNLCGVDKSHEGTALTTDQFVAKSKKLFGDRFDYTKTNYVSKNVILCLICPTHGKIEIEPWRHYQSKYGCVECDFNVPRETQRDRYIEKAKTVHGQKYDYSHVHYLNSYDKVEIICPTHGSFWKGLYEHVARKRGCPVCSKGTDRLSLEDFISKSKEVHGDRYDYGKVVYETNVSMVKITCKKHGVFIQRAGSHLSGCGCRKCHEELQPLSKDVFIENARKVHGNNFDYSKVEYSGNKTPVQIICPTHGSFWQKPNSHVSSQNGCRFCFESKGEKAVEVVLKKYNIEHVREYRVIPQRYRYDFFIPELNIYIEFHGHQHFRPIEFFGGEEAFLKCKERDEFKKLLVSARGGTLIVLTHLNLSEGSLERELIRRLKRIYRYWYVVNGKNVVCKTAVDVCGKFGLPLTTPLKDIDSIVLNTVDGSRLLFESL